MKKNYVLLLFIIAGVNLSAFSQGCVAVRQMGGINPLSTNGYTLAKGQFQIGTSYRYFHSFRHFIGTTEQPQRQTTGGGHNPDGTERGDAVNIYSHSVDLNISYGLTDRLQLNVAIPYVHNERSQVFKSNPKVINSSDTFRYSLYAKGLGDIRISAGYWVFAPEKAHTGNLMVGLGVKLNSGSHSASDMTPTNDAASKSILYTRQTVDQAIQPGDGGIGVSLEVQGFKQLYKGIYGFANGYYLFNPRESNGSYKSAPTVVKDQSGNVLGTLYGYNVYASPDQYFGRVGFMGSVLKNKSLTLSLAGRFEGIPAYDAFGGQAAYRRPGYVVAIESGLSYRTGKHGFSLFVPVNFIRNRIQSAADHAQQNLQNSVITDQSKKVHVQGDAAFADYSISVNYSYRIGKMFGVKTKNTFELSPSQAK
jgi:hypothetical protein